MTALEPTEGTGRQVVAWHGLTAEEVCKGLGVDPRQGLSPGEVERRRGLRPVLGRDDADTGFDRAAVFDRHALPTFVIAELDPAIHLIAT